MVEVRVLGPVELVDGGTVVRLPRAERTVLAALAARVGARVPVDVLEEAVWPQQRPPSARKSLQGRIVRLRRALGAAAIIERDGGYVLDPGHVDVDAERVAGLVSEARAAIRHSDPDVAVGLLAEASAAFRGEPYEDVSDTALPAGEAQRLDELRIAVVEEGFEAELARGFGEQCIGDLEAYVQANPYRERAWGQLMVALYQAGRPADALAAYGRARVLLAAELGIEPGPALRDVEQAILTHDTKLLNTRPVSTALGAANLPAAVSPIIGRQLELAALETVSLTERLVTLTGVGGIGKTRLAIELVTRIAGRDKFGPFFVDLAPIGDIELVPTTLAAALGVRVEPNADAITIVRSALAEHSVVVVLDNCEHLLPGIADLVGTLLASSPGLRVVATSRESLGVAGERVCPVDPLGVPPAAASTAEIESSDAGALFLTALPMNLTTPLRPDEVAAVGSICRSVDGIPLGLELAAARSRTLSLPELADHVERSINELAPSRHGVTARHRTMRAALDWGYQLLTPSAQMALRAMSVFAGGCELAAFTAICHDDTNPPAVDVIDELVRTSFATVDVTVEPTRYRLLEPVRQFARDLPDQTGVTVDRHRRHLHHYVDLAKSLTESVDGVGETNVEALRVELGNFRAALDWAAGDVEGIEAGLSLSACLWKLWWSDGHLDEALSRLVVLLGSGAGSPGTRSVAAYRAGFFASNLGHVERATELWEQALDEAISGGDKLGEVRVRRALSENAFLLRGDIETARQHIDTAIAIATEQANELLVARCTLESANLDWVTGALDDASDRVHGILDGPVGTVPAIEIRALGILVSILIDKGDFAAARLTATKMLEIAESTHVLHNVVGAHLELAAIETAAGRLDAAGAHLAAAESLNPDTARSWDPGFLLARADLAIARGDNAEALQFAERALAIEDASYSAGAQSIDNLRWLGDAQLAVDNASDALATYQRMIARAGVAPYAIRLAEGHEGCAAAAHALGNNDAARDYLTAATEIRRRTRSQRLPRPAVDRNLATLEAEQPARPDRLTADTA